MGLGSLGKTRTLVNTTTLGDGDSIASYLVDSAGNLLTSTLVGGKQALDVNIVSGLYAEDSVHASGDIGFFNLAVRNDAGTALAADGDYIPFTTDATGALRVAGTLVTTEGKAEDSAHVSGDTGSYVLSVRSDTAGTQVSADGDYASFQQTKDGYLRAIGMAETSLLQTLTSVATSATLIPAVALTNRKHITVQNVGGGLVYIGSATVTASGATQGLVLSNGGTYEADISDDVDLYGIAVGSAKDVVCLELA